MPGLEGILPVQQSFNGGELSPLVSSRIDQTRYSTGCKKMLNAIPLVQGPFRRRCGLRYLGPVKEGQYQRFVRLVPFAFSVENTRVIEFGHLYLRFWTADGYLLNSDGTPYEIASPYTYEDVQKMDYAQSADVIYIASQNHPPKKLMRFGDLDWRFQDITFRPSIDAPDKPTLVAQGNEPGPGQTANYYQVTVVDNETGDESFPSEISSITASTLSASYYILITVPTVDNAAEYRFYKRKGGSYGFIGRNATPSFEDRNIGADTSDTPPELKIPFEAGNYPSLVFLWQQRLGWAKTQNKPLTMWFSQSGNYENLSASKPPKDSDGIEATLASSGQNDIRWINGDQVLLMGTSGAEYTITGLDGDAVVTPNNISFAKQSSYGSDEAGTIVTSGNLLFTQRGSGDIHEFSYNYTQDRYSAPSMLLLATHLLEEKKVKKWSWQNSENILWIVLDDDSLIGCTYLPTQEVIGWHKHETDGKILDVTTIPGEYHDQTFFTIEREINGQMKIYVERFEAPFYAGDIQKAFYLDCGSTYKGEPAKVLKGLSYLEGKEVTILADGATVPPRIVRNGEVELPYEASWVHIGLPFVTEVVPNRPELSTQQGTSMSRKTNIVQATVHVYNAMSVEIGQEDGKTFTSMLRLTKDPIQPQLFTGDLTVVTNAGWDSRKSLRFVIKDPVPATVLSVVYSMQLAPQV